MQTAPVQTAQLPQQLLFGWVHLAQRINAIGVTIEHVAMPHDDLGDLDEATGILYIRADADHEDQVWLLQQAWNWLVIGPHASPFGQVRPSLRLVLPQQRAGELPA